MPRLPFLGEADPLPPTSQAFPAHSAAPGLLAAGGGLTLKRLEEAYRHGIYPWYNAGEPVLWWSPSPRMALQVADFKISRSLRKTLKHFINTPGCELRIDSAFDRVIQACAQTPRHGAVGTWIQPELMQAYGDWHRAGRVHSFETWVDGQLVGGLYGVGIGRMFFGESMFAHQTDASKIALAGLVAFCRAHEVPLIDCQQHTQHLASLGATELPRHEFERQLTHGLGGSEIDDWSYDLRYWRYLDA